LEDDYEDGLLLIPGGENGGQDYNLDNEGLDSEERENEERKGESGGSFSQ
jgi:hypothetical protein